MNLVVELRFGGGACGKRWGDGKEWGFSKFEIRG